MSYQMGKAFASASKDRKIQKIHPEGEIIEEEQENLNTVDADPSSSFYRSNHPREMSVKVTDKIFNFAALFPSKLK